MESGVVIVRVLFCGSVIAARAFPGVGAARDGPQFEVEYS